VYSKAAAKWSVSKSSQTCRKPSHSGSNSAVLVSRQGAASVPFALSGVEGSTMETQPATSHPRRDPRPHGPALSNPLSFVCGHLVGVCGSVACSQPHADRSAGSPAGAAHDSQLVWVTVISILVMWPVIVVVGDLPWRPTTARFRGFILARRQPSAQHTEAFCRNWAATYGS
jgi:hypothetical protein